MYLHKCRIVHRIGSLKVVTQQLLQQLIVNGRILTVKQLNDCVSSFSYGPDVTNKPSVIELNHITGHLKQSGKLTVQHACTSHLYNYVFVCMCKSFIN